MSAGLDDIFKAINYRIAVKPFRAAESGAKENLAAGLLRRVRDGDARRADVGTLSSEVVTPAHVARIGAQAPHFALGTDRDDLSGQIRNAGGNKGGAGDDD